MHRYKGTKSFLCIKQKNGTEMFLNVIFRSLCKIWKSVKAVEGLLGTGGEAKDVKTVSDANLFKAKTKWKFF